MTDPDVLWRNPAHWTALGYRCKEDPRVIVPKRNPAMGWTMNWAHPRAVTALFVLMLLAVVPMLVIWALGNGGVLGPLGMVIAALVAVPLTIVLVVGYCRRAAEVR
jgi:hypothetical protein